MSEENYVKCSLCSSYNWPRLFRNLDKRPLSCKEGYSPNTHPGSMVIVRQLCFNFPIQALLFLLFCMKIVLVTFDSYSTFYQRVR